MYNGIIRICMFVYKKYLQSKIWSGMQKKKNMGISELWGFRYNFDMMIMMYRLLKHFNWPLNWPFSGYWYLKTLFCVHAFKLETYSIYKNLLQVSHTGTCNKKMKANSTKAYHLQNSTDSTKTLIYRDHSPRHHAESSKNNLVWLVSVQCVTPPAVYLSQGKKGVYKTLGAARGVGYLPCVRQTSEGRDWGKLKEIVF